MPSPIFKSSFYRAMQVLLCSFIIFLSPPFIKSPSAADIEEWFTIDLIHRNSPRSPFYNASATVEELSIEAASNSLPRSTKSSLSRNFQSKVITNGGDYLMKISVGTPPVEGYAIVDTGSGHIWIQCQPCGTDGCYGQETTIFDPMNSTTYTKVPCNSTHCHDASSTCGKTEDECLYQVHYEDGSYSYGELASDTFTFDSTSRDGQPVKFPNRVFGCGHKNDGIFTYQGSGIVGLGLGALSLTSQLRSAINSRFSYCFVPMDSDFNSKLRFGKDACLSGADVVSTPIMSIDSDYYLNLEGVTVGKKRITNKRLPSGGKGNILIDSGTTLNFLEPSLYYSLEAGVRETIDLSPLEYPSKRYRLCYDKNSLSRAPEMKMVFHFQGADVHLKKMNVFKYRGFGLACLAMLPYSGLNIYGNWAQINFHVEYDLASSKVSFAPADCTQF